MKSKVLIVSLSALLAISMAGNIYFVRNKKSIDDSFILIKNDLNKLQETILEKDSLLLDTESQIVELEDMISDLQTELEDAKKSLEDKEKQKNSITANNSNTDNLSDTKTEPQQPTTNTSNNQQTNNVQTPQPEQPSTPPTNNQDTPSAGGIEQGNLGGDNGFDSIIDIGKGSDWFDPSLGGTGDLH